MATAEADDSMQRYASEEMMERYMMVVVEEGGGGERLSVEMMWKHAAFISHIYTSSKRLHPIWLIVHGHAGMHGCDTGRASTTCVG